MRRECKTTCSLTLPLYIEVTVPSQEIEQSCTLYIYVLAVFALIFFTYLPECQIWKNCLFIQTNSFIIFTCHNPVLLVLGIGQVSYLVHRLVIISGINFAFFCDFFIRFRNCSDSMVIFVV